jgi:hypothetical protein
MRRETKDFLMLDATQYPVASSDSFSKALSSNSAAPARAGGKRSTISLRRKKREGRMGAHVRAVSALTPKSDIDQLTFDARHKRTSPHVRVMSALPSKADITLHVRYVLNCDID